MDITAAIKPFLDIFTRSQVQSILLAWLPTKLNPYLTGIMAVDMFIITVIASGTSTLAYLIYQLIYYLITGNLNVKYNKSITIQIEYYARSEEHTSELQSQSNLVCRLLLEKKKKK